MVMMFGIEILKLKSYNFKAYVYMIIISKSQEFINWIGILLNYYIVILLKLNNLTI